MRPEFEQLLLSLPKTETHLHIEGALPWELLNQLNPERFSERPASHADDFRFDNFAQFEEELLEMAFSWYTSPERYHEAAKVIFEKHQQMGVRYVETSFASGVVEFLNVGGKAVLDAIQDAKPDGMELRIFMGIHHNGCTPTMEPILKEAIHWEKLAGIDLHGDETFPLEPWAAKLWQAAREAGKTNKAHAGELCGPEFVERVIDELGVRRIQHGVRAAESKALMQRLVDLDCVLDVCPISNVKLRVVESLEAHPIRNLMKAGVCCTISSDDPISFGNVLMDDYRWLSKILDESEIIELVKNGWRKALISDEHREAMLTEIDDLVEQVD